MAFYTKKISSFPLTLLLVAANSQAAPWLGENYIEPIHVRITGAEVVAPKTVYIQPNRYKKYSVSLEWSDDFKALDANSGFDDKVRDYLTPSAFEESLPVNVYCDQPFLNQKGELKPHHFTWLHKSKPGDTRVKFTLPPAITSCEIRVIDNRENSPNRNHTTSIRLVRNQQSSAYLDRLSNLATTCVNLRNPTADHSLATFIKMDGPQTTCSYPLGEIQNLENKIDGLQGKMTALLGAPLSKEFLAKKDPYAALDLSKAPRLDAILISYLVFRADYTGILLSRALKFHAARGTQIRILVSNVISLQKDKALFDRLTSFSPNIKVQLYRWNNVQGAGSDGAFSNLLSPLHRTVHSKLLITLSQNNPEAMRLIHGGRNVHDGFALKTPVVSAQKSSRSPYVNYGVDESWASWRDFEMEVKEPAFIQAVAQHFLSIWNRNIATNAIANLKKSYTQPNYDNSKGAYAFAKHLVSVPFQDGRRLQNIYKTLIDAAQKEIVLTSPYLRPPKLVFEALLNAVKRGVKLKIITRIDLHGDTADSFIEEVNKGTINKLFDQAEIYEYTVKDEILHSKLMVIDQSLSFVSSVNLNHRSFIHDIEDGILIHSPEYAQRLITMIDGYKSSARLVTSEVKTIWWRKKLVDIFKDVF